MSDLISLCEEHGVKRLEVFGSAATGEATSDTSDIDLLVDFERLADRNAFHQYFDFLFAVEELYGRHCDLVDLTALEVEPNECFLKCISMSREVIYGD